jgi:hypothetical protein
MGTQQLNTNAHSSSNALTTTGNGAMISSASLVHNLRNNSQPEETSKMIYVYDQEEAKEEGIAAYNRPNN